MPRRVALAGCFGFQNTGDDAILEVWLHDLAAWRENVEVVVLGGDDTYLREQFPGVTFVHWRDWPGTVEAIQAADLLVVGGGGLFHDYWAMEPETFVEAPAWVGPMYYLSLIGLAKLWERPCILTGVGIGPLRTEIGRAYVREVLAWADVITVRDTGSRDVLQSAGFPEPERVVVTADPVFRLPFGHGEAPASPFEALMSSGSRPRIGVAVRNWPGYPPADQWLPELAQALRQVARQTGGTVLFYPYRLIRSIRRPMTWRRLAPSPQSSRGPSTSGSLKSTYHPVRPTPWSVPVTSSSPCGFTPPSWRSDTASPASAWPTTLRSAT